jgi:hypothetical protein
MTEYRAYTVGLDGHFIGCEPLICSDDGEAMAKAKRLVDGYDIEVWSGERFVARVESSRSKGYLSRLTLARFCCQSIGQG